MTIQRAIKFAKNRIKFHVEFLEEIDKMGREDPDTTTDQLSAKFFLVVKTLVNQETQTLEQIISELKHDSARKAKPL